MGGAVSTGSIADAVSRATPEELATALTGLSDESKSKLTNALIADEGAPEELKHIRRGSIAFHSNTQFDDNLASRSATVRGSTLDILARHAQGSFSDDLAWEPRYGVIGCLSVKELGPALEVVDGDAKVQVKEESRAPFFTVMGGHTATTDGYDPPSEALVADKLSWLAVFDDKAAYHDGEHEKRTAGGFLDTLKGVSKTGDFMQDMAGGFMGDCFHYEATKSSAVDSYVVYTTVKANSEDDARAILDLKKQEETDTNCLRCTVFLAGGDMPLPIREQLTVRWVEQWTDERAHAARKRDTSEKIKAMADSYDVVEYANAKHYAKP